MHFCDATIENIAYYGGETVLTMKTAAVNTAAGTTLTVTMPNSRRNAAAPVAGQQTVVWWRTEDVITLDG
ncbi:TOBE domain-containing protein [Candidatus Spongiihabitans sp.]|uniref:TOBE domain-containing protein n=1 Tax=Candidatus Spongiihabitans sp. TaxID=3101308 RepID=UPI003C6FBA39